MAITAQGSVLVWTDSDVRSMLYPAKTYYTGFAQLSVMSSEGQERALKEMKKIEEKE